MATALSDKTIDLVKATVPALETHGLTITRRMYERMFQNPDIRDLFNQSHHGETGSQPKALAVAVLAYARNIDNLGALASRVERIAQKHVGLNILPEHYPAVAEALLGAIKDVLGDAATDEILAAWGEAYWLLADVLIAREGHLYRELAAAEGGWSGWRDFSVEESRPESEIIRSLVLVPADGGSVLRHRPGQYLTFALGHAGGGPGQAELLHLFGAQWPVLPHQRQAGSQARNAAGPRLKLVAQPGHTWNAVAGRAAGGRLCSG